MVLSLIILSVSKQALIKQIDDNTQAKLLDVSDQIQTTYDLSITSLLGELNTLEYLLEQKGRPEIIDNKLTLVTNDNFLVINGESTIIDQFSGMFDNQATIFQVIGNQAIRVSTNIRLESGALAIGTTVSSNVFDTVVRNKQKYVGFADVVGTPYLTVYSPLFDQTGKVIGIVFVGIKEVDLFQQMISKLSNLTFGKSGQLLIIDEKAQWVIKPDLSKLKQDISEREILNKWFFKTQSQFIEPVVTESFENGHLLKHWYLTIPTLNWTLMAYVYPEEFMEPLNQTKNTLIATVFVLIIIIAIITHRVGLRISTKAKILSSLAKPIKNNNLAEAQALSSKLSNKKFKHDEFHIIANALDDAIKDLNVNQSQIIELKERYRQFFEVNSSVKLVIEPETGAILEANSAAVKFYGYSHKTLTSMNISKINCLSEQEVLEERKAAMSEQRLYFEFKHKLASGEIKEVDVYSGPVEVNGKTLLFSIVHDVTQKNSQARELEEERFRLRSIVEGTDAAIWEWHEKSQTVRLNDKWLTLLGYEMLPSQQITTNAWRSRIHIKDLSLFEDEFSKHVNGQSEKFRVTLRHKSVSGKTLWIKHSGRFMTSSKNSGKILYCASVDVTELKEKEQQALLSLEKFEAIANSTMAGVLSLDENYKINYINKQFTHILGFDVDALSGLDSWIKQVTQNDNDRTMLSNLIKNGFVEQSFELNLVCKDGVLKDIMLSIVKSKYSTVATFVDITEQKKRENTIQYIANHDTLTGLYNRASFTKNLSLEMNKASLNNEKICILFMDLDGFKQINDTYGHDAGDRVLQIVANRMSAEARVERRHDAVARLGGDEFTAMLVNVKSTAYCEQIIHRILQSIDQPIMFNDTALQVTVSIGAVMIEPSSGLNSDAVLRKADHAMYNAKNSGKNRCVWFSDETGMSVPTSNVTKLNFKSNPK